nr:hypothetical protein HUO10_000112 [Paraburkholderia busanensis]
MTHTYEYQGFTLVVDVEVDPGWIRESTVAHNAGFVSTVRILRAGTAVALFSPLRFGDTGGRPFETDADALTGGCTAAQRIVDDLFSQPSL